MRSQDVLAVIRRRWRWVTAVTLLAVVGALAWGLTSTPTYQAKGRVYFSLEYGNSASDLVQGSNYTQSQVASFAELVETPAVLLPVINELDLDLRPAELARSVQAAAPVDTVLIEVSVTDTSPARSVTVANAVIESLSAVVEQLAPANAQGNPTVRATTVAEAQTPDDAVSPDLPLALAVGLGVGLLLGLGAAALRDGVDNRVRDPEVVARLTDLPLLGAIPTRGNRSGAATVVEAEPHSPHAEAFRQLRTNLQFVDLPTGDEGQRRLQVLAVTSSLAAEGKSSVAANLAVALAETGARVLLVDADLRRPAVARLLGIEGAVGLTTVLLGQAGAADVVQSWGASGLQVLPSGAVPPNPSELLGSPAMRRLLADLRDAYDYVVLDTAPLLPVADAAILSRAVDATLVVANVTRVRRHQFGEALQTLARVEARVVGVVLNQVRREQEAYAYEAQASAPGEEPPAVAEDVGPAEPAEPITPIEAVERVGPAKSDRAAGRARTSAAAAAPTVVATGRVTTGAGTPARKRQRRR